MNQPLPCHKGGVGQGALAWLLMWVALVFGVPMLSLKGLILGEADHSFPQIRPC